MLQRLHRRVVVEAHPERGGRRPQPPHQPGGVDEGDPVPGPQAAVVGGRVHLGAGLVGVEQLGPLTEPLQQLRLLAQLVELPRRGSEGDLAVALHPGVDAVAVEAGEQRLEVLVAEAVELVDLGREVARPVGQTVGQRFRHEAAVAGRGPDARLTRLEHHDVAARVVLLGLDGGPEPGEPGPDDGQVRGGGPGQRRAGLGTAGLVQPVRGARRVRQRRLRRCRHRTRGAAPGGPRRWPPRTGPGRRRRSSAAGRRRARRHRWAGR